MEMHDEKERTEGILGEVDTHLYNLGLIETVDNYLNSQAAYAVVDTEFDAWIKTLRDFVAKMPEVAHEAAGKAIDVIVSSKDACRKAVYIGFKQNLSAALEVLADYVCVDGTVKEIIANAKLEEMWNKKLSAISKVLLDAADEKAKTDIMIAAIEVTDSEEDQMALSEVLAQEPKAHEIIMNVDKQAYIRETANILAISMLGGLFGGMFGDDEDEDDE